MADVAIYQLTVAEGVELAPVDQPVGQEIVSGAGNTSITTNLSIGVVADIGSYIFFNAHINALDSPPSGDLVKPIDAVEALNRMGEANSGLHSTGVVARQLSTVSDVTTIGDMLIDEDSFLMYGLDEHTIENGSEQTEQTLGAGEINTVPAPAAMGANPDGPQIPRGRNPIVFVNKFTTHTNFNGALPLLWDVHKHMQRDDPCRSS